MHRALNSTGEGFGRSTAWGNACLCLAYLGEEKSLVVLPMCHDLSRLMMLLTFSLRSLRPSVSSAYLVRFRRSGFCFVSFFKMIPLGLALWLNYLIFSCKQPGSHLGAGSCAGCSASHAALFVAWESHKWYLYCIIFGVNVLLLVVPGGSLS